MAYVQWTNWIYPLGPDPSGMLTFANTQTAQSVQLANDFIAGTPPGDAALQYHSWATNQ